MFNSTTLYTSLGYWNDIIVYVLAWICNVAGNFGNRHHTSIARPGLCSIYTRYTLLLNVCVRTFCLDSDYGASCLSLMCGGIGMAHPGANTHAQTHTNTPVLAIRWFRTNMPNPPTTCAFSLSMHNASQPAVIAAHATHLSSYAHMLCEYVVHMEGVYDGPRIEWLSYIYYGTLRYERITFSHCTHILPYNDGGGDNQNVLNVEQLTYVANALHRELREKQSRHKHYTTTNVCTYSCSAERSVLRSAHRHVCDFRVGVRWWRRCRRCWRFMRRNTSCNWTVHAVIWWFYACLRTHTWCSPRRINEHAHDWNVTNECDISKCTRSFTFAGCQ